MKKSLQLLAVPLGTIVFSLWIVEMPNAWAKCWTVSGATFCDNREGTENNGGSGPGNTSPGPAGPSPEELKQQREHMRLKAKAWSSDEALDYFDRKDWDNAIRSFEEALDRDPDDPDLNDWLKRAKAEKAKARMPAPNNNSTVVDSRNEPAGLGGKSDFKGAFAKPAPTVPSSDPSVVDARNVPSGLPKGLENAIATAYASAPPGVSERVRKGFQAVMARDWKVANAWFEDALNRDPGNAGLKRLVALTDSSKQPNMQPATVDARNEPAGLGGRTDVKGELAPPSNTKSASTSTTNPNLQLPDQDYIYMMFPGLKAMDDKEALDYLFGLDPYPPASKSGKTK
jgi:tetratricopeptide (TPR) repeat protein